MLRFLVEEPLAIYVLLFVLVALSVALWWRSRQGRYLVAAFVGVLLGIGLWFLGAYYETDNLQIQRHVLEMGEGVKHHDLDRIFAHIADSFRFNGLDKAQFHKRCAEVMDRQDVTDVEVWEFEPGIMSADQRQCTMTFRVKPRGNFRGDAAFYLCRAEFVHEADGQWRMQTFQVFNPYVDTHTPLQIPGM